MGGKSTGRVAKPTAIKKAQGTLRKDRSNENEPEYAIVKSIPEPPSHFSERAIEIYYGTGLDLINQGLLTGVAFPQFVNYCYVTASALDLQKLIVEQGYTTNYKGRRVQNDNIKSLNIYMNLSRQLANEFGLTPATSGKVEGTKKVKTKLDDFI